MDKRYQVFVSSTYADLKDERQQVMQALMELDCIPAGMELFPATDEEQFEFIKRVIDDCDYYIVIIGGRYGSLTPEGISYTEQEYEYALERGIKVVGLLHENPEDLPLGKSEKDPELSARLQEFRERVATGRLVKFWKSQDELPGLVALSLSKTIKLFPATGWVRADRVSSEDLLSEINDLRKRNSKLEAMVRDLSAAPVVDIVDIASLEEKVSLRGRYRDKYGYEDWRVQRTWEHVFGLISPYLQKIPSDSDLKARLTRSLFAETNHSGTSVTLDDQDFQTISIQMQALGLVRVEYSKTTQGGMALFWHLTPRGQELMFRLRTVRAANAE